MTLILTEKPSVARAFAAALGVPRKEGWYENDSYCVVNARGHLLENYEPDDYDPRYKKWAVDDLPIIPEKVLYRPVVDTAELLDVIKKCFDTHKDADFILATDAEREGELIGAEILAYVGFKNYATARRFWVSEALTPEVVRKGIETAKPLADYTSYKDQGYARQEGDWLCGMNLTRLVTLLAGNRTLLTVGRVQTAVLAAIVSRESEVTNFKPQKYAEIEASLENRGNSFTVKLTNPGDAEFPTRFSPEAELVKRIEAAKATLKSGTITKMTSEKKTVKPPQLYNLTALQKDAAKFFGLTPEQTLAAAQALYETHKCLSYPRTPSRVMGDENIDLVRSVFEKLAAAYPEEAAGAEPTRIDAANKRLFNSAELDDHHALIPLAVIPDEAEAREKNVYSLVLKQFFMTLRPDYVYNAIRLAVDIGGFAFQGAGVEVLQGGWKERAEKDEEEAAQENYAGLEEGKEYPALKIERREKLTEPKKRYTYTTILALMENPRGEEGKRLAGLGTPATRGDVLGTLVKRKYVEEKGKTLIPTQMGIFLVAQVLKNAALSRIASISETTRWGELLRTDTAAFLKDVKAFVREAVKDTSIDKAAVPERTVLGKCPLCGGEVFESVVKGSKSACYCANYKASTPCKFTIWKETAGAAVSAADVKLLLAGKQTKQKKCRSKAGKEFSAAFTLEMATGQIKFVFAPRSGA